MKFVITVYTVITVAALFSFDISNK